LVWFGLVFGFGNCQLPIAKCPLRRRQARSEAERMNQESKKSIIESSRSFAEG
jgi:hypothetical protein